LKFRLLPAGLALGLALGAPAGADALRPGAVAPDFTLPAAVDGRPVPLKDLLARSRAVAVIFIATKCPVSNAYNGRMAALAKEYAAKGIAVVGVNSNATEPASEVVEHAKKNGLDFPILKDPGNKVADAWGATRTPEVFLLDPKGVVLYHGRIDENQDDPKSVQSPDLRNALDAVLAGRPVPKAETKAFGCTIKRA
jgi:peroxiredoxin